MGWSRHYCERAAGGFRQEGGRWGAKPLVGEEAEYITAHQPGLLINRGIWNFILTETVASERRHHNRAHTHSQSEFLRIWCFATLLDSIAPVPHLECCSVCLERAIWRMYDNDMTRTRQWYDNGWGECQLITRAVCFHISYTTEPNLPSDTSTRQMLRRTIYLRLIQYSTVQKISNVWMDSIQYWLCP